MQSDFNPPLYSHLEDRFVHERLITAESNRHSDPLPGNLRDYYGV